MLYSYTIAGRCPGVVKQSEYAGLVEADTPKIAIIKAIVAEFGDQGVADPLKALSTWSNGELLREQFADLSDGDSSMELQTEEHSFAIEVDEAKDAIIPAWLDQFVVQVLNDVTGGYERRAVRKHGTQVGLMLDGAGPFKAIDNGLELRLRLKDRETGQTDWYGLVFDFKTGIAYLTNDYDRIGYAYKIKLGSAEGAYAE